MKEAQGGRISKSAFLANDLHDGNNGGDNKIARGVGAGYSRQY